MPAPKFTVETRKQAVLIVGDSRPLVALFSDALSSRSIEVFTDIRRIGLDYDLDYCLVLGGDLPRLSGHSPRLLYLHGVGERAPDLPPGSGELVYPDVIGHDFSSTPVLDQLVHVVLVERLLKIGGDGLDPYHVITSEDLIHATLAVLFAPHLPRHTQLASASPLSLLSLAYQVRSSVPYKIDIIFGQDGLHPPAMPSSATPVESTSSPMDLIPARVKALLARHKPRPTLPPTAPPPPKVAPRLRPLKDLAPVVEFVPKATPRRRLKFKFRLTPPRLPHSPLLTGLVLGICLYLSTIAFALTVTFLSAKNLATSLSNFTLPSTSLLKLAGFTTEYLRVNFIALPLLPGDVEKLLGAYQSGLNILAQTNELAGISRDISAYMVGDSELDIGSSLQSASLIVPDLYNQVSLLDADLPPRPPEILPSEYHQTYLDVKVTLESARRALLTAKAFLDTAPDLLGLGGRRKYLVLLQNNMELRSTGGFIGSFAVLSFENGRLYDLPIYDVYQADGALKGHVEPPEEIKEYLGEGNWYMRDSNWDPDFPTSARRAEWYLKKTLGIDVNGTIAVNIHTLSGILNAVGGVEVPDYQETVTGDNIFERAEFHSEVNFFPGSTGKKEFLGAVASALYGKIGQGESSHALTLTRALVHSIDSRNTLISVHSPRASQAYGALGWDGALRSVPCPTLSGDLPCFSDYAMLVENNFGINKANYFVDRTLSLAVTLDADLNVSHKLTSTYTNRATSGSWPAGPYKNYLRLYLPPGFILESVYVGNRQLANDELNISSDHGKTVIGFLVEVPIKSTVEVGVEYRASQRLPVDSPVYSFYWQKQPGTNPDPLSVTLSYPLYLEPEIVSPHAELSAQQLSFKLANTTDRRITVKFKK